MLLKIGHLMRRTRGSARLEAASVRRELRLLDKGKHNSLPGTSSSSFEKVRLSSSYSQDEDEDEGEGEEKKHRQVQGERDSSKEADAASSKSGPKSPAKAEGPKTSATATSTTSQGTNEGDQGDYSRVSESGVNDSAATSPIVINSSRSRRMSSSALIPPSHASFSLKETRSLVERSSFVISTDTESGPDDLELIQSVLETTSADTVGVEQGFGGVGEGFILENSFKTSDAVSPYSPHVNACTGFTFENSSAGHLENSTNKENLESLRLLLSLQTVYRPPTNAHLNMRVLPPSILAESVVHAHGVDILPSIVSSYSSSKGVLEALQGNRGSFSDRASKANKNNGKSQKRNSTQERYREDDSDDEASGGGASGVDRVDYYGNKIWGLRVVDLRLLFHIEIRNVLYLYISRLFDLQVSLEEL